MGLNVRVVLVLASVIGGVAIACGVAHVVEPSGPGDQLGVAGDTTVVVTKEQLSEGITLSVPPSGKEIILTAIEPFTLESIDPPAGSPAAATGRKATLKAGSLDDPGDYLATVAAVGDASRKVTVKLTDGPLGPAFAVLAGLAAAYVAGWWISFARRVGLLRARALEALADAQGEAETSGDVNNDARPEYSILPRVEQILGTGGAPERASVWARANAGDFDGAEAQFATLKTLRTNFIAFTANTRQLYGVHQALLDGLPTDPPPLIVAESAALVAARDAATGVNETEIATQNARVTELLAAYPSLRQAYSRLAVGATLRDELQETDPANWTPREDAQKFGEAVADLTSADKDLREARTSATLTGAATRIEAAIEKLRGLRGHLGRPVIAGLAPEVDREAPDIRVHAVVTLPAEEQARLLRAGVLVADWVFLMFGVVAALVTAMAALYVGKGFGSSLDYAAAFLWGVGVDQALKGLSGVLGKLGVAVPIGIGGGAPKSS